MLTILSQYIASIIVVGKVSRGKVSRGKVYIPVPGPLVYNLYTGPGTSPWTSPGTVSGFLDSAGKNKTEFFYLSRSFNLSRS